MHSSLFSQGMEASRSPLALAEMSLARKWVVVLRLVRTGGCISLVIAELQIFRWSIPFRARPVMTGPDQLSYQLLTPRRRQRSSISRHSLVLSKPVPRLIGGVPLNCFSRMILLSTAMETL